MAKGNWVLRYYVGRGLMVTALVGRRKFKRKGTRLGTPGNPSVERRTDLALNAGLPTPKGY